jgi:hypothetical protein
MPQAKPVNPFYVAILPVGVIFGVTACAYVAMMVRGNHPAAGNENRLLDLLDRHGLTILIVELVILGILTVGAIATDGTWERRFEAGKSKDAIN